jgi:hypothetical protein
VHERRSREFAAFFVDVDFASRIFAGVPFIDQAAKGAMAQP